MNPKHPVLDIMDRTMVNLEFIKEHKNRTEGPFEVTQLINSFVGALAHPWEKLTKELKKMSIEDAVVSGWPSVTKSKIEDSDPKNLGDLLRLMRNGVLHGNFRFLADGHDDISKIEIWNTNPKKKGNPRTWGTELSIDDLEHFLKKFVELAKTLIKSNP